jgi:tetratricopeptide (TPR) repeat protein
LPPRQKLMYFDSAEKVGRRVHTAREAAGLSQRDLGAGDCTAAYISRIEKGERVPSLQLMRQLADRLGVSEGFLAYGTKGTSGQPKRNLAEARVATRLGDLEVARELVDAALSSARSDHERAHASAVFGQISLADGSWSDAVDALERARKLDPTLEQTDHSVSESLGRAYAHLFDYPAAIAVFSRALQGAKTAGDNLNQVRFATLLAHANSDSGDFAAADQALAIAVRLSDELGDPLSRARALWGQSRVAALQGHADAAAGYAEVALETLEVADQTYYAALARQLLANIELDRGNDVRALELLEQAEPLLVATGRIFERSSFNIEKARALLALGRGDEAGSLAMEAAGLMREESSVDAGRAFLLIADLQTKMGNEAAAIEMYELAVEKLSATPNRYAVEAYSKLADLFERNGNPERAYELLKEAMSVQQQAQRMLGSATSAATE